MSSLHSYCWLIFIWFLICQPISWLSSINWPRIIITVVKSDLLLYCFKSHSQFIFSYTLIGKAICHWQNWWRKLEVLHFSLAIWTLAGVWTSSELLPWQWSKACCLWYSTESNLPLQLKISMCITSKCELLCLMPLFSHPCMLIAFPY